MNPHSQTDTPADSIAARVVRKPIGEDCMLEDQLHPSIAERLNRVRELPVACVANLHRVERDGRGAWLVWEHVEGANLDAFLESSASAARRQAVAAELKAAVGSLHAHGIVHGALHERNIIIDPAGRVHLTHISPLLYSDPAYDLKELARLLERLMPAGSDAGGAAAPGIADQRIRRRAYVAAAAALAGGLLIFFAILWYIRN